MPKDSDPTLPDSTTSNTIDLHMHSRYSDDGEFSPEELVDACYRNKISIMAIADHNCAKANKPARKAALAKGITYISAMEIDCTFQGVNFHVLGYGIDEESTDFSDIEKNIEQQSTAASHKVLALTQSMGFHITVSDMMKLSRNRYWHNTWTGEMFGEVLLDKPEYKNHPLLLPYRPGGARSDNPYVNFYWDYYSQGKPCYAEITYPELEQIVNIIHDNGGLAVLAHPGINLKSHPDQLIPILQTGMDGIEAFSSYHSPEQSAFYYGEAQNLGLFATCGSDYHGKTKPSISMGKHGCPLSAAAMEEQLKKLLLLCQK